MIPERTEAYKYAKEELLKKQIEIGRKLLELEDFESAFLAQMDNKLKPATQEETRELLIRAHQDANILGWKFEVVVEDGELQFKYTKPRLAFIEEA